MPPSDAPLSYEDKVVLAPMVRVTSLPFRILAAQHGAEVLFSEELIAQKIVKTKRREDVSRNMVEYILTEQHGKLKKQQLLETLIFATLRRESRAEHPEGAPVVLQIGSAHPHLAAQAAQHMERDVDGIDLNMGCPKEFSLKGGMGAALLSTPQLACDILKSMASSVSVPVTVKMRMLPDKEEMLSLLRNVATTGVKCVSIHARFKETRYETPPFVSYLEEIVAELRGYPLPIVFNGDVKCRAGCFELAGAKVNGVRGVMIARGALQNPTCFSSTPLGKAEAYSAYLKLCAKYKGGMRDVKYTLSRSFQEHKEWFAVHDAIQKGKSLLEMWVALGNEATDEEMVALLADYQDPIKIIPGVIEAPQKRKREEDNKAEEGGTQGEAKRPCLREEAK